MSKQKFQYKRRQFYIKKEFQFRFILKFCLLILLGAAISTCLLVFLSQGSLTYSLENSKLVIKNTSMAILPAVIYTNLITLGLTSLAVITVTLFVSHKIAGPLFRFEEDLKIIGKGDLTKIIRLRQEDQISDLAQSLNEMTSNLHDKVENIQNRMDRLIESGPNKNSLSDFIEELKQLRGQFDKNFKI